MPLPIPWYSYEQLRIKATAFLCEYHTDGSIPIPIEHIVEFDFDINIVPVHGLQKAQQVVAWISSDLKSLMVDKGVVESRSPNRYRYSLAHELAHAVLHKDIYRELTFSTIEEWKCQITAIPEDDYKWLEYHAYTFAGLILVPDTHLRNKLQDGIQMAKEKGLPLNNLSNSTRDYICNWIGRSFEVSSDVIRKRLDKDELWTQHFDV